MSYFNFKPRAPKTTERQKLEKKVDAEFSIHIRIRNVDEHGFITCITCGDRQHWSLAQCGHYVKRGNHSTRWHLQNCGEQCSTCNVANDGMEERHKEYIDLTYGPGTSEKLERLGREVAHFSERDLQGMLDELRKENRAIREEKGMI
jgi:hypothetical protein